MPSIAQTTALAVAEPFVPMADADRRRTDPAARAAAALTVVPPLPADEQPAAKWRAQLEFAQLDPGCPVLVAIIKPKKSVRIVVDREQPNWRGAVDVTRVHLAATTPRATMRVIDDALAAIPDNESPVREVAPSLCVPAFGYTRTVPWCTTQHRDDDHPADRAHCGDYLTVDLSNEPGETDADGVFWPERIAAYLIQHDRHDAPVVELGREDTRGMLLTVDEAQELANNLLCLVAAARNAQDLA